MRAHQPPMVNRRETNTVLQTAPRQIHESMNTPKMAPAENEAGCKGQQSPPHPRQSKNRPETRNPYLVEP